MSRDNPLVQLTCPDCGYEDQAFLLDLEEGTLFCEECGAPMEEDDQ